MSPPPKLSEMNSSAADTRLHGRWLLGLHVYRDNPRRGGGGLELGQNRLGDRHLSPCRTRRSGQAKGDHDGKGEQSHHLDTIAPVGV